jgi:hypothetical protein
MQTQQDPRKEHLIPVDVFITLHLSFRQIPILHKTAVQDFKQTSIQDLENHC